MCNEVPVCDLVIPAHADILLSPGLNTGYPVNIQQRLLTDLGLDTMVDTWISAAQVSDGRPYPYMVWPARNDLLSFG